MKYFIVFGLLFIGSAYAEDCQEEWNVHGENNVAYIRAVHAAIEAMGGEQTHENSHKYAYALNNFVQNKGQSSVCTEEEQKELCVDKWPKDVTIKVLVASVNLSSSMMKLELCRGWRDKLRWRNKEIILDMLKEKADMSFISKVMGLSEKEIKKILYGS